MSWGCPASVTSKGRIRPACPPYAIRGHWRKLATPSARGGVGDGVAASSYGGLWLLVTSTGRRKPWHLDVWHAGSWTAHALPARLDGEPVLASSGDLVFDGHDGVWIAPYLHWTGHRWVNAYRDVFPYGDLSAVAPVPGTRSAWGVGSALSSGSDGIGHAIVAVYGKVP
jgi:hypothetical protein